MDTLNFNILRYPHGRTKIVDGIDYEAAEFVICPKCWKTYTYIYLNFIAILIAIWFWDVEASLTTIAFIFAFNSISKIVLPRLLPGTKNCQDIPFPPQSGEAIELQTFMYLVFNYTSEESKTRFLNPDSSKKETKNEIKTKDKMSHPKRSENEQESEDSRNYTSRNNSNHLDEYEEFFCSRREFERKCESNLSLSERVSVAGLRGHTLFDKFGKEFETGIPRE